MTKEEIIIASRDLIGGTLSDMPLDDIYRLMTVTQFVTDLCLNEVEQRGGLTFHEGAPCVPYESDHFVETILTRQPPTPELSIAQIREKLA